jgi:hypothetical protein
MFPTALLTLRVAAVLLAASAATSGVTRIAAAERARRWLDYPFTGVPARIRDAVAIFAHNARALLGVFGLLLIAQLAARAPGGPSRAQRATRAVGELLIAGLVAANVLAVGASLGAYGERMARAMLPHGPVELAAFSLGLALYVQGRDRPVSVRHLAGTAVISMGLLFAAALLETFG